MARYLVVLFVLLSGCVSYRPPIMNQTGITGRLDDDKRYDPIPVNPDWKWDLQPKTETIVKRMVQFPRTARLDDTFRCTAYYDTVREVTELSLFGNADSTAPWGEVVKQSYYVTWEMPGDIRKIRWTPDDWTVANLAIQDYPF